MLTNEEADKLFTKQFEICKQVFVDKLGDYGACFYVYRDISLYDQIWIKIKRIRQIEEQGALGEGVTADYIAIINYAIIFMLRKQSNVAPSDIIADPSLLKQINTSHLESLYDELRESITALYRRKNHDYNNAWQDFAAPTITDLIIIKLLRVKNIIENNGEVKVSEDICGQLSDIIVYSIFALILKNM